MIGDQVEGNILPGNRETFKAGNDQNSPTSWGERFHNAIGRIKTGATRRPFLTGGIAAGTLGLASVFAWRLGSKINQDEHLPPVEVREWDDFTSKEHGYSIKYPRGWTVKPADFDIFKSTSDPYSANIGITGDPNPNNLSLLDAAYIEFTKNENSYKKAGLEFDGDLVSYPEKPDKYGFNLIAGKYKAFRMTNTFKSSGKVFDNNMVIFVTDQRIYICALQTPKSETESYLPMFKEMLDTIKLG